MADGQRYGTRDGYQQPKHYRTEFELGEETKDFERCDRAIKDYYSSQGYEFDDPSDALVRDFTENQLRLESRFRQWDGGSWRTIRRKGVLKACEEWILSVDAEARFQWFVERDLCRLTIEALVTKHSNRFREDIFVEAIRRAIRHGEKFPLAIFQKMEEYVRSHPTQFSPAVFADLKLKRKRLDSMRREWE